MPDDTPPIEAPPSRTLPFLPALIFGAGLVVVGLLHVDARVAAFGFVVAGLVLSLLARGARGRRPARAPQRTRSVALWPDASVKSVVEAMREPAFVVDRSLAVRFCNQSSVRAFGSMTLGDPIALRFRAPDLLHALEVAASTGEAQAADFNDRLPIDRSWGVDILPIRVIGDARPTFFLILFRDHTQARRLERMRTDFVANASHELRTPLASLTGFIETLKGPARDDAAARMRFLDIMQDQARRMSRLIDDLLSLSRIETKRRLRPDERVDLARVLTTVCQQLGPYAQERSLDLSLEGPVGEVVTVNGDMDELIQVFSNLVENACKYGAGGGRVIVGLRRDAGTVEAYVQDFGQGIAPEHVPRLTERFYRVEDSVGGVRGTGLGLSIVRNVLSRHHTRVAISSIPGQGATFSVRFIEIFLAGDLNISQYQRLEPS